MNYDDNESLQKTSKEAIDECIDESAVILGGTYEDSEDFDKHGIHKITGTKYDPSGFTRYGKDKEGYGRDGWKDQIHKITGTQYDQDGFKRDGYDTWGYDKEGYGRRGLDKDGKDRNGIHVLDKKN